MYSLYILYTLNVKRFFYKKGGMELVSLRLPDNMKDRLERIAEEEHRPLSNLLRLIIMDWLSRQEERGSSLKPAFAFQFPKQRKRKEKEA